MRELLWVICVVKAMALYTLCPYLYYISYLTEGVSVGTDSTDKAVWTVLVMAV